MAKHNYVDHSRLDGTQTNIWPQIGAYSQNDLKLFILLPSNQLADWRAMKHKHPRHCPLCKPLGKVIEQQQNQSIKKATHVDSKMTALCLVWSGAHQ